MEVARKKKLQTGAEEANIVIDTSVTGNELTVSIVQGHKAGFLYGFGEVASGLGFEPGDEGRVGKFDFDFMSPDTFNRAKQSARRISNKTIDGMMKGDAQKFARRNVRNIIKEGIRTGRSDTDIANDIGQFFDDSKYWKAAEITRTEIPLAYNYGRIDAARNDGLTKARIYLGGRPCNWCIDNHLDVTTLDQAEAYMNEHHPNNDCTVVPLIDFDYYGVEPPEGYYEGDEGPLEPPIAKPGKPKAPPKLIPPVIPKAPPPAAPPVTPAVLPEVPPVTVDPEKVGDLPKETGEKRAKRRAKKIKEAELKAPTKSNPLFEQECRKRYAVTFESGVRYDKEKVQAFIDSLDAIKGRLRKGIQTNIKKTAFSVNIQSAVTQKELGSGVLGDYWESRGLIRINEKCRLTKDLLKLSPKAGPSWLRETYEWVSTHEYSHHVYKKGLTLKMRTKWRKIWPVDGKNITWYAKKNSEEGFSESFAAYLRSPEALKEIAPETFKFFEKVIMRKG